MFESKDSPQAGANPDAPDDEWHGTGRMNPTNAWQPSEYSNRVSVVHPSHRPHLTMAEGVVWERLAATPEHAVNFMKIVYAPGATSTAGGDLATHDSYEYGYVLVGEVEVTIGDEVFHLHEGESLGSTRPYPTYCAIPDPVPSRASGSCTVERTERFVGTPVAFLLDSRRAHPYRGCSR